MKEECYSKIMFSTYISGCWLYTVIVLLVSPTALSSGLLPDEQVLLGKLFNEQQYDNSVRPVFNSSKNVEVMVGFTLIQIMDMVSHRLAYLNMSYLLYLLVSTSTPSCSHSEYLIHVFKSNLG